MQHTDFNYHSIPESNRSRNQKLILAYSLLALLSVLTFIWGQGVVVVPGGLGVALFFYHKLFSTDYLRAFAKDNSLQVYDYPKLAYSELPFFNKIYRVAFVGTGIQLQVGPPLIEIFTYSTAPLWRSQEYQVLHIRLSRQLPNVIVDARSNDNLLHSDLPVKYSDITSHYSLEGTFPDHFKVYGASDQSTETLQLLSPELMATLLDSFSNSNIEFVRDSVFITTRTKYVTRKNFASLIDASIGLSGQLERKARKMLHIPQEEYNNRITKI